MSAKFSPLISYVSATNPIKVRQACYPQASIGSIVQWI